MLNNGRNSYNTTEIKSIDIVSEVLPCLGKPSHSWKAETYRSLSVAVMGVLPTGICQDQQTQFTHSWWAGGLAKNGIVRAKSSYSPGFRIEAAQDRSDQDLPLLIGNMKNNSHFRLHCFIVCQRAFWIIVTTGGDSETCCLHRITFWIFAKIWGSEPLLILPSLEVLGSKTCCRQVILNCL